MLDVSEFWSIVCWIDGHQLVFHLCVNQYSPFHAREHRFRINDATPVTIIIPTTGALPEPLRDLLSIGLAGSIIPTKPWLVCLAQLRANDGERSRKYGKEDSLIAASEDTELFLGCDSFCH